LLEIIHTRMRSDSVTALIIIATATLTLGLAAITSSYDIVGSVHAAKPQFCFHAALDQTKEPTHCFDNRKDCNDAQAIYPLADTRCVPVRT